MAKFIMDTSFADLLDRLRRRDEEAAEQIFYAFSHRLIALARSRLDTGIRRKVDAEDIVQSVFRSFFRRHGQGEFVLNDRGGLWSLLVVITLHKCGHMVEYYHAACRNVHAEQPLAVTDDSLPSWEALSREPSPSESLRLADLVEDILRFLEGDKEQQILQLSLQGCDVAEISNQVERSERTVHRVLSRVRQRLEQMLQ